MAKTRRGAIPELPWSADFYARIRAVGARFGLDVADAVALTDAVSVLSRTYTRERSKEALAALDSATLLARLAFFLPRDAIKMFGPLAELARAGRFAKKTELSLLDLGAGLGTSTLGAARFFRAYVPSVARLSVTAIEQNAQAGALMHALCAECAGLRGEFPALALSLLTHDFTRKQARGPFDLIVLGLSLNELYLEHEESERVTRRAALLRTLSEQLCANGALIVLEPALHESARELMKVRDLLCAESPELHVLTPCVHRAPCPMLPNARDWCHETLAYALPPELAQVARGAGLRYEGLRYAALVLSKEPRWPPDETLTRIVSDPLRSKGKHELYGCSVRGYQRLTRLERDASAENQAFAQLGRGDVTHLTGPRIHAATRVEKA